MSLLHNSINQDVLVEKALFHIIGANYMHMEMTPSPPFGDSLKIDEILGKQALPRQSWGRVSFLI